MINEWNRKYGVPFNPTHSSPCFAPEPLPCLTQPETATAIPAPAAVHFILTILPIASPDAHVSEMPYYGL